jgi:hypothetical protein
MHLKDRTMTRLARGLLVTLPLLLLPVTGRAGDPNPTERAKGSTASLELACAVARAVGVESICRELVFFKHEDERRMGEELAQLLDADARNKALKLIDAELAEKARKEVAGKDCPPGRPLCPFSKSALIAVKDGLGK